MEAQYIPEHPIPRVGTLYRHRSERKFWFDSKTFAFEKVAELGELVLVTACDCRRSGQYETVTATLLRSDGSMECGTYQHYIRGMHPNAWSSWWEEVE